MTEVVLDGVSIDPKGKNKNPRFAVPLGNFLQALDAKNILEVSTSGKVFKISGDRYTLISLKIAPDEPLVLECKKLLYV